MQDPQWVAEFSSSPSLAQKTAQEGGEAPPGGWSGRGHFRIERQARRCPRAVPELLAAEIVAGLDGSDLAGRNGQPRERDAKRMRSVPEGLLGEIASENI